ncbi:beta-carotene hydroxylase [Rapidithrix thailandica]|uniref:Beta-carotene hydroxylase n=1 Tax=Rapidithrix thailandica TaxID=413964 RepID=A0AAW9SEZ9_9BACT
MDWLMIISCGLIVLGTFLFWELVAWFTHKYVMHGFLWVWHKSHHTVHGHTWEKNDWFAVVFSLPSIGLFYYATLVIYNPYLIAIGLGIFCYGLFYFVFHDILVHQRIKWRPRKRSRYLQRMIHAHYIHHSKHSKDGCEAFGFLYAPKKYDPQNFSFRKNRQKTQ